MVPLAMHILQLGLLRWTVLAFILVNILQIYLFQRKQVKVIWPAYFMMHVKHFKPCKLSGTLVCKSFKCSCFIGNHSNCPKFVNAVIMIWSENNQKGHLHSISIKLYVICIQLIQQVECWFVLQTLCCTWIKVFLLMVCH